MTQPQAVVPARSNGACLSLLGTLVHTALMSGIIAYIFRYVPSSAKAFDEFGMALPRATTSLLELYRWFVERWVWVIPVLPLVPVVDYFAGRSLRLLGRIPHFNWLFGVTLILVVLAVWTFLAIELPMNKLMEGLNR